MQGQYEFYTNKLYSRKFCTFNILHNEVQLKKVKIQFNSLSVKKKSLHKCVKFHGVKLKVHNFLV